MSSWCFAEVELLHDRQVLAVSDPASRGQPAGVHLMWIEDLMLPPLLRQLHVLCPHIRPWGHFASLAVTTLYRERHAVLCGLWSSSSFSAAVRAQTATGTPCNPRAGLDYNMCVKKNENRMYASSETVLGRPGSRFWSPSKTGSAGLKDGAQTHGDERHGAYRCCHRVVHLTLCAFTTQCHPSEL